MHPPDHRAISLPRTYLFTPAHRPRLVQSALASRADRVILDLEDAVARNDKDAARRGAARCAGDPRVVIRINPPQTAAGSADLDALRVDGAPPVVMVPKATAAAVRLVSQRWPGFRMVALIESAIGLDEARQLARLDGVERLAYGALDLALDLGLDPHHLPAQTVALHEVVLASALAGLPGPIAPVTTRLGEPATVSAEAREARRCGFAAKLLVHPQQIEPALAGLRATADEVRWASAVLSTAADGAAQVAGQMVDAPVLTRARGIMADHLEQVRSGD